MNQITNDRILRFKEYLIEEERATATVEKYMRDIRAFAQWLAGTEVCKSAVVEYKQAITKDYAPASVNSMLSALNSFFEFNHWFGCKVKTLKLPKQIFSASEQVLSKAEYARLLEAAKAKRNEKLYLLMQTICATGIRISELRFITVEAVAAKQAIINCKGKMRVVIFPQQLCKLLQRYLKEQNLKSGSVFVTKSGKPLDRSNLWREMKQLCSAANVNSSKVFPHNFRHLFARTYYSLHKDIVRLADILGHTSVNTTRIYTMESGEIHRRQLQRMGLLCMET